jgi:osmotically inducible lipoprotein OsmB
LAEKAWRLFIKKKEKVMNRFLKISAPVAMMAVALAACGTNPGERAISGAGLGAASGAVIGAAAGNPAMGAAVGAVAGGVGGAVTRPDQVDLGRPIWK